MKKDGIEKRAVYGISGIFLLISFFILSFNVALVSATLNVSLSNQGTEVKLKSTGELLTLGNLTVTLWDSLTGGNLIYNETFVNAIVNGSWGVMLGENSSNPLPLEFGRIYYFDYEIDGSDVNFTIFNGTSVGRQFFYSPLGDISDEDISDITNLTLGEKITFTLGEIIDNIIDGWIRITGGLNVTDNLEVGGNVSIQGTSLTVSGTEVCLSDGTGCETSNSNITFNPILGFTSSSYDGNITNGSLIGYPAANAICAANFAESHFCLKSEVLKTIANGNFSFSGTSWFQNGPPGFTANANDCSGWTDDDNTFLGPFWNWDANAQAGQGALTNCAQTKPLACCGGSN